MRTSAVSTKVFTSKGDTSGMFLAICICSCCVRDMSSSCCCHSWRSLYTGLPKYSSTLSSPPRLVRTPSILWLRLAITISWLTVRESTFACIRNIFDSSMLSSMSQRMFLSEAYPFARIICTSCSMSESIMNSPPTTATVLSIRPLYFCAPAAAAMHRQAAAVSIFFII